MHEFERKGLGEAPYTLKDLIVHDGLNATCSACGTRLKREFIIQSADGQSFSVGSECVKKTTDSELIAAVEAKSQSVRLANLERLMKDEEVARALAAKPHPTDYYAQQGKTLLDYVKYMQGISGVAGHLKIAAIVEKVADDLE